jgi:hypothetical protein
VCAPLKRDERNECGVSMLRRVILRGPVVSEEANTEPRF